MGAPYWDQYAHGTICGLTRGSTAAHIARAALEGIAFQTMDIVEAMRKDAGLTLAGLKVDGGASRNNLMMQFQADVLGTAVVRPSVTETTALGACYLGAPTLQLTDYYGKPVIVTSEAVQDLDKGWIDKVLGYAKFYPVVNLGLHVRLF